MLTAKGNSWLVLAPLGPLSSAQIVRYFAQHGNAGDRHEAAKWSAERGVFRSAGVSTGGGARGQSDLLECFVKAGVPA